MIYPSRQRRSRPDRGPAQPSAVEAMLARDGVLDDIIGGRGLRFDPAQVIGRPPGPVDGGLVIEPPPWSTIAPPDTAQEPVLPVTPLPRIQFPPADWRGTDAPRDDHGLAEEIPGSHPPALREPS